MFYVSPGVYTRERDISTRIAALSTTIAGIVGYSKKGSLALRLITNAQQFITEYGEPVAGNYFHYSALAYLEQGNQLYCRRIINGALYPGVSVVSQASDDDSTAFATGRTTTDYYADSFVSGEIFSIFAKDPGDWGDRIGIIIKNVKNAYKVQHGAVAYNCLKDHTSTAVIEPGAAGGADYWEATSDAVTGVVDWSSSSKEYTQTETSAFTFEIDVYFTDIDGVTTKVENWLVSRKTKKDGYGKQLYLEDRINDVSKYLVVADSTTTSNTLPKANSTAVLLGGGTDGSVPSSSDIAGTVGNLDGWFTFYNPDDVDVRILIGGCFTTDHDDDDMVVIQQAMKTVAESRKDCVALFDVPEADSRNVSYAVSYREDTQNFDSSYTALFTGWPRINDAYNDKKVYVPPSGYAAAAFAYNDYIRNVWNAPAGHRRGKVNSLGVNVTYTQGERNTLYAAGLNPIQLFRGRGTVIWGQKTQQKRASTLDRLNVRRLLITIEKAIAIALEDFVFESNDEFTRFQIVSLIETYLDRLSAQGAFQTESGDDGFLILCDDTNNTAAVFAANELHVDIFVKPISAAEFIQLQTIITPAGASFEELIAQGVQL